MNLTRKISPALPVMDAICKDVDSSFTQLYHGTSHSAPSAERDISRMVARFHDSGIHTFTPGRSCASDSDRPSDYFRKGLKELETGEFFNEAWETREVFLRYASTAQNFELPPESPIIPAAALPVATGGAATTTALLYAAPRTAATGESSVPVLPNVSEPDRIMDIDA